MADPPLQVAALHGAIRALVAWLDQAQVPGAIVGGVAASILGRPRLTRDVDAVVMLGQEHWTAFLASGQAFGFRPRIADALEFAQRARVLLLRHEPSGIDIDIAFGALPFEAEMLARSARVSVGDLSIPLPTPEDLIIMKVIANRPRDWEDIEAIVQTQDDLDHGRIRHWVEQFADVLEMPELHARVEGQLRRRE